MKCVHDFANGDDPGVSLCAFCVWVGSAFPRPRGCPSFCPDSVVVVLVICREEESGVNVMKWRRRGGNGAVLADSYSFRGRVSGVKCDGRMVKSAG